jgi:glycosyltransferase involved in cell wall biosynthesis
MLAKNPIVSVVIPVYNEERDIEACLNSLHDQTYSPLEIIIVDDGSKDHTVKILKKLKGFKYYLEKHRGPGYARNKGVLKTKGEIIVFVDADMTFERKFIEKLTKPIRNNECVGTFSLDERVANYENQWARLWSLHRGWQAGRMHPEKYPSFQNVFRAIKKEAFISVGGFDTNVGYTDDWTIAKKLGQLAIQVEGAIFYHRNPDSLAEIFSQAKWMAKRPYKLGIIGTTITLIRVSFPFSLLFGIIKSIQFKTLKYLIFRLVFDFGQFLGISSLYGRSSRAK